MTRRKEPPKPLLDEIDAELWAHVTRHVMPLPRAGRVRRPQSLDDASAVSAAPVLPGMNGAHQERPSQPQPARRVWRPLTTTPTPRPAPSATPAVGDFDRKRAKRIAAGAIAIDGRIDLHGLRESEAHVRLIGFLRRAHADGRRTVLVITGKGRDSDDPYAPFDPGADRAPRGVLKRNVPRWLCEPDLAAIVVSFTPAHTRHGGDGALYVHLRRLRD